MAWPAQRFDIGSYTVRMQKLKTTDLEWEPDGAPIHYADLKVSRHNDRNIVEEHHFIRTDVAHVPVSTLKGERGLALVYIPRSNLSLESLRNDFKEGTYKHYLRGVVYSGQEQQSKREGRTPHPKELTWRADHSVDMRQLWETNQLDAGGVELYRGALDAEGGRYRLTEPEMCGTAFRVKPLENGVPGIAPTTANDHPHVEHWVVSKTAKITRKDGPQCLVFRVQSQPGRGSTPYKAWLTSDIREIAGTFTKVKYYRIVEVLEKRDNTDWLPRFDPKDTKKPPTRM